MGTTTLVIGNEALSAYLFHQVKEVRSSRHIPCPVTDALIKKAETISNPGERFLVRWRTRHHSIPSRLVTGYEDYNPYASPTLDPGHGGYAAVVQPIFISEMDERRNQGGVVQILNERVQAVEEHGALMFQQTMLRTPTATGTWPGVSAYEDWNPVNGGDSALGIIEDQAGGTNTLHNLAKTSYPVAVHPHFHNDYYDAAGDASANLLNMMQQSQTRQVIKGGAPASGSSEWWVSEAGQNNLKRVYREFERYTTDGNMDDAKRAVATFGGVPIYPVADMPNSGSGSTSNPWTALRVDLKDGIQLKMVQGWNMDHTGFVDLPGRVGTRVSLVKLWGQLLGYGPGRNTLVVDGEVF